MISIMHTNELNVAQIITALTPFAEKAKEVLPQPMMVRLFKWIDGNRSCAAAALRSECQTHLSDITLLTGRVKKVSKAPDGRRPGNTTWIIVPTLAGVFGVIVRNVVKHGDKEYRFLSDTSAEISSHLTERLIDVPEPVNVQDIVVGIERARKTSTRMESLAVKILIGNIDHASKKIRVEDEIPIFNEGLTDRDIEGILINREQATHKSPDVPVKKKGTRPKA
ncbi:MAG: hypothetical protein BGO01_14075 [Armatimonadetes bacterium 55-13]|nr:MAG: hypothetical protein BGO01_14075 [Armatimonadetes bacterium 55-13]